MFGFGFLVGLGLGFSYNYLLQVRGRKSGKLYSTPIDLLERDGKRYLVAPRGRTQGVRNAEAAGEIILKKGGRRERFRLSPLPDTEKPAILKAYLDSFKKEVQTYFPVPAGSPVAVFVELTASYPALLTVLACQGTLSNDLPPQSPASFAVPAIFNS